MTWSVSAGGPKKQVAEVIGKELMKTAGSQGWSLSQTNNLDGAIVNVLYAFPEDCASLSANGHGSQLSISVTSYNQTPAEAA